MKATYGERVMKSQITDVRGIGPSTARALEAQGFRTVAALAKAKINKVSAVQGFAEIRAAEVIAAAVALLAEAGAAQAAENADKPSPGKKKAAEQKKKKDKNKKKIGKDKKMEKKKNKKKK